MAKCWKRLLSVKLSNGTSTVTYGNKYLVGKEDVAITVKGSKYMGALKDVCKIVISNLPYSEVLNIIDGKYFDVEVWAGYENGGDRCIFSGGTLYISGDRTDTKTSETIILCGSKLLSKFSQKRINLTLNSGINLYAAAKAVAQAAGISNPNISPELRSKILENTQVVDDTVGGWFGKLLKQNSDLVLSTDDSRGNPFSLYSATRGNGRYIVLTSDLINITGGYPQISSEGVSFSCMPTYNFSCGDTIKIDNSIIQAPVQSQNELKSPKTFYLDKDGEYVIFEIDYTLENRGEEFGYKILAKSRNLFKKLRGE